MCSNSRTRASIRTNLTKRRRREPHHPTVIQQTLLLQLQLLTAPLTAATIDTGMEKIGKRGNRSRLQ